MLFFFGLFASECQGRLYPFLPHIFPGEHLQSSNLYIYVAGVDSTLTTSIAFRVLHCKTCIISQAVGLGQIRATFYVEVKQF